MDLRWLLLSIIAVAEEVVLILVQDVLLYRITCRVGLLLILCWRRDIVNLVVCDGRVKSCVRHGAALLILCCGKCQSWRSAACCISGRDHGAKRERVLMGDVEVKATRPTAAHRQS